MLHIYSCFLPEEQIFKNFKRGRPPDAYWTRCGTSWGANDRTFEGSLPDVGKTYFSNSTHKHIKLTLTVYFIVNGSSKKFNEQYNG